MERRYVPLRPLSPKATGQERGTEFESSEPRKPRIGVSVACNDCRRKKIRCDGQRPVCSNCQGKTNQCEYRDEGGPSKESRDLVVEVVRTLGQLPTSEAIQYLHGLKEESDALTILSTLRQGLTCKQLEADNVEANPVLDDDGQATQQEWRTQNPTAYPGARDRDTNLFQKQPYLGLIGSTLHDSYTDIPMSDQRPARPENENMRDEHQEPHEKFHQLCDSRLHKLNIHYWTNVDIDNDLAAKCISLYLETDHPLLGHFDPDLFVSDLVSEQSEHCSSLLVNSLLYWACQMYSAIDPQTDHIAIDFCTEAEGHLTAEYYKCDDSILVLAATEFLCLGYLGQGRDHAVLRYLTEAANMAGRMGLFSTEGHVNEMKSRNYDDLTGTAKTSHMYAAWGIFNWLTSVSRNLDKLNDHY
ncbi:hypothetical protein QQS21_008421 [Conoideocrella luteorostrata]|uniref:Zn(2)-C6 fungal-type domain-containing protein n=1 Tax=Conoideocrella luteorostrata TaxID=1105319 RepID=A0AAJ0CNB5_9HYPO|nr:hypothetical protein QQS21_008421 [Conoideocrella luteorostrata]